MLQKHHVNRMAAEGDGQGTLHKVRMLNSNFFITDHRIVITGEKPVTVSVCAITNYDVVIIKWCLKPGVASFILVLYVAVAIKGRRRHRRLGAVADMKRAGLPVSDSGWDVGGVGLNCIRAQCLLEVGSGDYRYFY